VLGSLPSAIKRNPLAPFYRFSPLPRSPVVPSHLPAVVPSLACRRPSSAAPATALPRRPAVPSPPPASQPPPLRRPALCFPRRPPEARARQQPVALPPPTASSRPCRAAQVRAGRTVSSLGIAASTSTLADPLIRPETAVARAGLSILFVAGVPSAAPPSSPARRLAAPPPPPASQRQGRPRPRLPFDRTPPVFVVVVIVPPRRLVISRRRLRRRHRSDVFHAVLVSVQPLPAALVASSPAPVVVVIALSSFPVVVAFVPPSSRSRLSSSLRQVPQPHPSLRPRLHVVKPHAGRVSPSFKDRRRSRSLAVRLRRARSSLSFPRLVAWW
jgi:hypothetical protein